MKRIIIFLLCCLGTQYAVLAQETISGTVRDAQSKEPLAGTTVRLLTGSKTVITDSAGWFRLPVSGKGPFRVQWTLTGYGVRDTVFNSVSSLTGLVIFLDPETNDLDEVIIVASSRTNSRIEDLPTKVEVLGAEEVQEENGIKPGNIASLLGDIAGIQIQPTSVSTGNVDMRIQGLQGKYTQILRDGIPLFGGYSGSFSILQIPPLDLQQIELIKGASSTLYGGGAIAGMLNLVPKKPKLHKPERSLTLNQSTLGETNLNLFLSARNERNGYTLFAGGTQQLPQDINKDGFSDLPLIHQLFLHPRYFWYGKDRSTLALGYTLSLEDRNGGNMQVVKDKNHSGNPFFIRNKSQRHTADLVWEKPLRDQQELTLKASTSWMNRDVLTNGFGMQAVQLNWFGELAYSGKVNHHTWVMGMNLSGERFRKQQPDSTLLPNTNGHTVGFFAQGDWKWFDRLTLQTGLRTDWHNRYGWFVLPRVSLMWKASQTVTLRLGTGWGYKTPTLFNAEVDERSYRYLNGFAPGIKAEGSMGVNMDINYKKRLGDELTLTLNQTFFFNSIRRPLLLETDPVNTGQSTYLNAPAGIRSAGMETYVQLSDEALELYLGYVYTHARRRYDALNPQLPLIARHKLASVVAYRFGKSFRAGIEAAYTGKQFLDDGTTTSPYLFAAAMVRYNIGKVALVLNGENLFDYRQNKKQSVVFPPYQNPSFPEIWAPLDGRVINLSLYWKW